jgi:hypothetical protein
MTLSNILIDYKIISYSYIRKFDCPVYNLSSCIEKDCHCSYIDDFEIRNIDYNNLVKIIFEYFYPKSKETGRLFKIISILNNITKTSEYYILDRLCSIYKLWDNDSYVPNIYKGYYGQELNGVFIKEEISKKIEFHFNEIQKKECLEEKIYYILKLEYGYILNILENKNISIKKLDKSKIEIFNKEYKNNVISKISKPSIYGIKGILLKNNNKYTLIDGYHRYINDLNKKSLYLVFE